MRQLKADIVVNPEIFYEHSERCPQQKKQFHFWRQYNRQAAIIVANFESNLNVTQASLPVEGWTKKYSGVGESRTT